MLRKTLMTGLTVTALAFSASAFADHNFYNTRNSSYSTREYAEVVDVKPIVRYVRVKTPRRECWDDVEYYRNDYRPHRSTARRDSESPSPPAVTGHGSSLS